MKKILIALALGIALVFAIASVASADNGPHGGFNGSTDACASCHRVHSAVSADGMLLVQSSVYNLCTSCHDGTGAYTNVVDGYYDVGAAGTNTRTGGADDPGKPAIPTPTQGDPDGGLYGGGFVYARMLTDWGNAANEAAGNLALNTTNAVADQNTSTTSWAKLNHYDTNSTAPVARHVTSSHTVEGVPVWNGAAFVTANGAGTIWGSGNINTSAVNTGDTTTFNGTTNSLECTSCHNPHGNAGKNATGAPMASYRLLEFTPASSGGFQVANNAAGWNYAVGTNGASTYSWNLGNAQTNGGTAGITVPDTARKWYTVNNNVNTDPSVIALRGRYAGATSTYTELFVAVFAGQGDYMGKSYGYQRPALKAGPFVLGGSSYVDCNATPTQPPANSAPNTTTCAANAGSTWSNVAPHNQFGQWCATCHDRYLAQGGTSAGYGTRTNDSGDLAYHYRHISTGTYTCIDCHNAHGTAATASSTLASNASYATGSVLLKADNRALCVRCHAAPVNFFNMTTSPTAPMVPLTVP